MKTGLIAFAWLLLIVARVDSFGFFGAPADNELKNHSSASLDKNSSLHDTVNILLNEIQFDNPNGTLAKNGTNSNNLNNTQIPEVEFKKLKDSGVSAGLPPHKADRLARAAKLMNMSFDEIADTRKVLENATTSADYADKVRRSLEEFAVNHQTQSTKNELNKQIGNQDASSGLNSTPLYTLDSALNGTAKNNSKVDPQTLHRMAVTSKLTGLEDHETHKFLRAIIESNMTAPQAEKLQQGIIHHGATADDLKKLTNVLETNATKENATNKAADSWETLPEPPKIQQEADHNGTNHLFSRGLPQSGPEIYSAVRNCGFSPVVLPNHKSNVSPGQFPWDAAILLSDDTFVCSGTLISNSIILTTASCVFKYKKTGSALKVVLGAWNFPTNKEIAERPELELFAKAAVIHPKFHDGDSNLNINNIGLIRLSQDVNFDLYPHIFPICVISSSLIDSNSASRQCKVQGWPNLVNLNVKKTQAYLAGADVTSKNNGCPSSANSCANGPACMANEGSGVICPGKTGRFYQWGIVADNPKCSNQAAIIDLNTISVLDNYDFIQQYLFTSNPAVN